MGVANRRKIVYTVCVAIWRFFYRKRRMPRKPQDCKQALHQANGKEAARLNGFCAMGLVKTRRLAAMRKQQKAKAGLKPPPKKVVGFKKGGMEKWKSSGECGGMAKNGSDGLPADISRNAGRTRESRGEAR